MKPCSSHRDPHPPRSGLLASARPSSHLISSRTSRFYHLSSVSSGPPSRGSLCSSSRLRRSEASTVVRRPWFRIAVSDIISPAVPPGEVLYFLGASGSSFLFAANGRRELVVVDLSAQLARQLLPVRRRRSPTVRVPLSRPPKLMAQRGSGLSRPTGLARHVALEHQMTQRRERRHGAYTAGDVYPVEPYESLSMNQVLDAHWGVLDDEDVVVWFSTGYITIKDMVVTGMPIRIVGVAALTVLLPTLDMVMVVVIRYFRGIKLGTGGLVRAYGGVASECLKDAPTCLVKRKARVGMEVPFDLLGTVYNQPRSVASHPGRLTAGWTPG
ncbi:hypothetical protein ZWY2020_056809 [Hordeum vulgare]|nr:hypothetical protein ZWY2020_056809 [Hordeum vulgare]